MRGCGARVFHAERMADANASGQELDYCSAGKERRPVFLEHSKLEEYSVR